MAAAVGHVDTTLCAGLDALVTVVLALQDTTPALCASTKEAAVTYASQITTYLASFTLAQVVLKASDLGLDRGQHAQAGQLRELRPGGRGHEGRGDRREKTEEIVEKKAEEMVKEAEEMVEKGENVEAKRG